MGNKYTVNIATADYAALRRYVFIKALYPFILPCAIILALVEWGVWRANPSDPIPVKIFAVLFSVGCGFPTIFLFLLGLRAVIVKLTRSGLRPPVGIHEYEITDQVLRETNCDGHVEKRLQQIKSVAETKRHIFVLFLNGSAHIFPKRDLTPTQAVDILSILKARGRVAQPIVAGQP